MKKTDFTLVELLIAVAIINILAAIAIPAYNDYVEEARLTSAKSSALSIKPYLEEHYLETGSYFDSSTDTYTGESVDFYEEEVDNTVYALSSLLEPLIMVVIGTIVGGLVIALYLPIFQMGKVVGG